MDALQIWNGRTIRRAKPTWTEDQIAELVRLWGLGQSGGKIGNQLGKTRCAILGKLHRLGINADAKAAKPAKTIEQKKAVRGERVRVWLSKPRRKPVVAVASAPAVPLNVPLLELQPQQCRQPCGDGVQLVFCGRETMGRSSYCAAHVRMNYRPTALSDLRRITARITEWR